GCARAATDLEVTARCARVEDVEGPRVLLFAVRDGPDHDVVIVAVEHDVAVLQRLERDLAALGLAGRALRRQPRGSVRRAEPILRAALVDGDAPERGRGQTGECE